jgi:hypothetical protein
LLVQSGGGMRISSTVGKGTTVEVWFPVAAGVARAERVEAVARAERRDAALSRAGGR